LRITVFITLFGNGRCKAFVSSQVPYLSVTPLQYVLPNFNCAKNSCECFLRELDYAKRF
jgi:hypothetical protein